MDATATLGGHPEGAAATVRGDRWWVQPALTVLVLGGFVVYTTWAALQGNHYYPDPYSQPVLLAGAVHRQLGPGRGAGVARWFGELPGWWPRFVPCSPAFFILVFPGAFRFTCYYYRKAYYRSFAGSPPACAVGPLVQAPRYRGETLLLVFQNLHRYALYFALLSSCRSSVPTRGRRSSRTASSASASAASS